MKPKKVLFSTDHSRTGDLAFALAASIAHHAGAELMIVHVAEDAGAYGGAYYHGTTNPTEVDLQQKLAALIPAQDVASSRHLLSGKPAPAIVRFAGEHQVDLIVMGTHGCSGISSVLVGSVAEEVIRTAPCPVLAVKTVQDAEMYGDLPQASQPTPLQGKKLLDALENLVHVCVDSARGLQAAADDVSNEGLQMLLADRAAQRRDFAEQLQLEAALRGKVPKVRGTLQGRILRQWIHLKKAFGDDLDVLHACLKEEEHTFDVYRKTLQCGLPSETRETLTAQLAEIQLLDRALRGLEEAGVLELNVA